MLLTLKHIFKMVEFKFIKPVAQYKNAPDSKVTISNSNITNESALEFLKTNPERIKLFSVYPENWQELIGLEPETAEELEKRLVIEAEMLAAQEAKDEEAEAKRLEALKSQAQKEGGEADREPVKIDRTKLSKEHMLKMSLADLRKLFPEVNARSIVKFVDNALEFLEA